MSKKWMKIGGFGVSAVTILSLAGCGQNVNSAGANSSGAGGNQPVQLTFWYGLGGNLSKDVQKMVQEFNQTHPNIHVTATYQGSYSGGGAEQQKLLAALKAGDPPTLAQIEVHSMPVFASTGKLIDLTSFMQNSSVDAPNNFLKGMLVSTELNGKYYGVPFNRSVPVLYYNKTLFQKAGITAPPTTWSELEADAKKLTQGSGANKVYGFEPLVDWWPWEYSVWSGGGHILANNLNSAVFDSSAATHVLSMEQSLVKSGYAKVESGPQYWTLMTEDFIQGKTAMDIDSIGSAAQVKAGVKNFSWGTALLPKDATLAVPPGGGDIAIVNGASSAQIKAAESFIEWWTSPAQTAKWSEMTGYLPVQQAALNIQSYQDYLQANPQFKTALEELQYQHAAPASPNYLAVLQYVQQALQGIFDEGQPIGQAMKSAVKQANGSLQ